MYAFNFEKLEVWQEARGVVKRIYQITDKLPKAEEYGLKSQIRRAAVSICMNLAEGSGRRSQKEKAVFYRYAYGSMMETISALAIGEDLGYLEKGVLEGMREELLVLSRRISALENAVSNRNASPKDTVNPAP